MDKLSLNKEIIHTFKWYKKLTKRFIDLAFLPTTMVVIATLFSQLFMLLSSMMPLKVIMLLGSPIVPSYFPLSWQSISRDTLVIYLAIASVGFFLFYLLSERIIDIYSQKGSNKVLQNNQKIVLFQNQDLFAKSSYAKLSQSLSNIIFFILSLVGLGVVYPLLSLVILLFVAVTYIIFSQMHIIENLNKLLDLAKGIGFFIVFAFILTSFIVNFYPPEIIIVILSVLLIRQMLIKLYEAIRDIVNLAKNREKVNSLFFFRHVKVEIPHESKDPFWSMIDENKRKKWIAELFNNMLDNNIIYISSQLYKVNIKNIAFFKVILKHKDSDKNHIYLLKLFNKNISSQAIHESTLLEEYGDSLFSLPFLGSIAVEEFHCNIFEFSDVGVMTQKDFNVNNITIRSNMMTIKLHKDLTDRYSRSHPYLYERLRNQTFSKYYLVYNIEEMELIKKFESNFNHVIKKLEKLPLQVINPAISRYSLIAMNTDLLLLHWGGWKIDSLGVGYPIGIAPIDILKKDFKILQGKRKELENVNIEDIILSSLMTHYEILYNSDNFTAILELIPRILECIINENDESM
ncbi:MAG: hypothetical protein U9N59_13895 [Campylobacterota bacterium]|nr:hypothetical protein [Campylobacterota bacterium]